MFSFKRFLNDRFQKLKEEGSFTQNFSWTLSGTSLGFAIQLLFSPILSRIYSPEAYGEFAIYNIIVTNLVSFSTLSYPDSLITCKSSRDFTNMSFLILFLTFAILSVISITYFPFQGLWMDTFPKLTDFDWMPIVLIMVVLSNINDIQVKWNIVNKKFKKNFQSNLPSQVVSKSYSILYGVFKAPEGLGLVSSEIVRSLVAGYLLAKKGTKDIAMYFPTINKESIRAIWSIAKEYKNYPRYIWPANWMNMFSNQLPILFFAVLFTPFELGAYAFANSMVAIPGRLIGNAVRPVFFQKSQEILENEGKSSLKKFTKKVFVYLAVIGGGGALLLFIWGEWIFEIAFGENWLLSGKIASIVSIALIFSFPTSPVASIFRTLKKEKTTLLFQVILFVLRLTGLISASIFSFNYIDTIILYVFCNSLAYLLVVMLIFKSLNTEQ